MGLSFYRCPVCGEMVLMVKKAKCTPCCCGKEMVELKAGAVDAALEKHVPACSVSDGVLCVKVGSVEHPMTEEHHIAFIWLVTDKGVHRAVLDHTGAPEAVFRLAEGEKAEAVYEFCNLHGLWKKAL